jgi:hypothetical protein
MIINGLHDFDELDSRSSSFRVRDVEFVTFSRQGIEHLGFYVSLLLSINFDSLEGEKDAVPFSGWRSSMKNIVQYLRFRGTGPLTQIP